MYPQPPTLPNGNTIKERIHLFGPPKIGKTHQLFQIAKWHHDLGSDAMFYGMNTDTSWEVLYFNEEFQGLPNIEWRDCNYLQDYVAYAKEVHKKLRPQDWFVLDLADHAWQAAQDEYARAQAKKYGGGSIEDMGDLWAVSDAPGQGKYPIEGWEWGQPNARYRVLANNYLLRGNGHRMVISSQAKVMEPTAAMAAKEDETAKKTREMFKHLGVHPAGQKDDPFRYHTILHIDSNGEKMQKVATAGERWGNRRWMGKKMTNGFVRDEPIEDFFMDYLVGVAGWKMQ